MPIMKYRLKPRDFVAGVGKPRSKLFRLALGIGPKRRHRGLKSLDDIAKGRN